MVSALHNMRGCIEGSRHEEGRGRATVTCLNEYSCNMKICVILLSNKFMERNDYYSLLTPILIKRL